MWARKVLAGIALILSSMVECNAAVDEEPRSVVRLSSAVAELQRPTGFDPAQSAGLFVGVRQFSKDESLLEVPYAVDDAVDLAHLFALELRLLDPRRVALALAGEAAKEASRNRLKELQEAGATVGGASATDIYKLLDRQTRAAGPEGLLVVSFATHGFSTTGIQLLMAEDSFLGFIARTAIPANEVFDAVSRSAAVRRIVFLDACREQVQRGRRGWGVEVGSGVSSVLEEAMAKAQGQVILSAARPGGITIDDHGKQQGVFTAYVLDGLRCKAKTNDWGYVTAATLADYVNEQVKERRRRMYPGEVADPEEGIESSFGGDGASLPLRRCQECTAAAQPDTLAMAEERVEVYNRSRTLLWVRRVGGTVSHGLVADLDGDGSREVVVGVDNGGEDTGKVIAFDCKGDRSWSTDTGPPFNYDGGHGDRMVVTRLAAGDLFGSGQQQIVSLSQDSQGFYPSRLCIFDSDGRLRSSYWHPGHLHRLAFGSETPGDAKRIFVSGVNNDLRSAFQAGGNVPVVFMLDPHSVGGEAPPYAGRSGRGTELWYGLLVPSVVSPPGLEISRLEVLDRDRDGRNEINIWSNKSHILYLGFNGRLIESSLGDGAQGTVQYGLVEMRPP